MKKSIEQDIAQVVNAGKIYYPGGEGGGGSRRKSKSSDGVVLPHEKTSPSCAKCHRYHTTAEHDRHSHNKNHPKLATPPSKTSQKPTKAKPTKAKPTKAKSTKAKSTKAKSTKAKSTKAKSTRAKSTKAKSTKAKSTKPPPALPFIRVVQFAVANATPDMRYNPEKVYVSELWDKIKKQSPFNPWSSTNFSEFKKWLLVQNHAGTLQLARADIPRDIAKVNRSEITTPFGTFHTIVDPDGFRRAHPR